MLSSWFHSIWARNGLPFSKVMSVLLVHANLGDLLGFSETPPLLPDSGGSHSCTPVLQWNSHSLSADTFSSPASARGKSLCPSHHPQLPWGLLRPSCAYPCSLATSQEHGTPLPLSQFCALDPRHFHPWSPFPGTLWEILSFQSCLILEWTAVCRPPHLWNLPSQTLSQQMQASCPPAIPGCGVCSRLCGQSHTVSGPFSLPVRAEEGKGCHGVLGAVLRPLWVFGNAESSIRWIPS